MVVISQQRFLITSLGEKMDFAREISELQKKTIEHKEYLLTEEATKTSLVLPFLRALGYDVFNPSEVIPEYTADIGLKKGEKVDYAICNGKKVNILIECKPSSSDLNINHAGQLYRYFAVTKARLAILTNGVSYQFFSDIENANIMDSSPFFELDMTLVKPADIKILEKFTKISFDIDSILTEAQNLKLLSSVKKELEKEFSDPSEEFTLMIAKRIHDGRITQTVKENFEKLLSISLNSIIKELVSERLESALNATEPENDIENDFISEVSTEESVHTTDEEMTGYRIIQAISAKKCDPKRIILRDSKSYCAILLDDNNRKTVARLHFNGKSVKYIGLFSGKDETRHQIDDLSDIYSFSQIIEDRLQELS
jgi:hypothetical protein